MWVTSRAARHLSGSCSLSRLGPAFSSRTTRATTIASAWAACDCRRRSASWRRKSTCGAQVGRHGRRHVRFHRLQRQAAHLADRQRLAERDRVGEERRALPRLEDLGVGGQLDGHVAAGQPRQRVGRVQHLVDADDCGPLVRGDTGDPALPDPLHGAREADPRSRHEVEDLTVRHSCLPCRWPWSRLGSVGSCGPPPGARRRVPTTTCSPAAVPAPKGGCASAPSMPACARPTAEPAPEREPADHRGGDRVVDGFERPVPAIRRHVEDALNPVHECPLLAPPPLNQQRDHGSRRSTRPDCSRAAHASQ